MANLVAMKTQPLYSKEEFARRGDAIYEHQLRPIVETGNEGKFVAIDIETGAHEVDSDELAASDRLLARIPNAQIFKANWFPLHASLWVLSTIPGSMITGVVTDNRRALIRLIVVVRPGMSKKSKRLLTPALTVG